MPEGWWEVEGRGWWEHPQIIVEWEQNMTGRERWTRDSCIGEGMSRQTSLKKQQQNE